MRRTMPCEAAEAAAGILRALESGDAARLDTALDRASRLSYRRTDSDSWAEEQAELLEVVVSGIRERMALGAKPCLLEPQAALLGHLAGHS